MHTPFRGRLRPIDARNTPEHAPWTPPNEAERKGRDVWRECTRSRRPTANRQPRKRPVVKYFRTPVRRSTKIAIAFGVVAEFVFRFVSYRCLRHAFSLSGAAAEDWFAVSRLFGFAERACLILLVPMLVLHAVDIRRVSRGRPPTSAAWVAAALAAALLSVPAQWLFDYWRELRPTLERTMTVEQFAEEFPKIDPPEGSRVVILDKTRLAGSLAPKDRIPFAVRGNRFVRIRPDGFHQLYGSVDVVPADTNLVYIHSCRTRYRTTLRLRGVYW